MSRSATAEQWSPVPGYEGLYDVSDQGRLRSWRTGRGASARLGSEARILALLPGRYLTVVLCRDGRRRTWTVHRLVALAFLGPCPDGLETRHLNGDALDCRLVNLRYGTRRENAQDAVAHGTLWMTQQAVNGWRNTGRKVA